ncbi:MAG: phosphoglycerate kinase [Patescibacteria group bacterium]|jgi:3-phosphoglycerate kinase
MPLRSINNIQLKNQRVLLRLDLNVPLKNGQVPKDGQERLLRALPTIKYLLAKKASVIIVAHLGRPEGKIVEKYSLRPVATALQKVLGKKIIFWPDNFEKYFPASKKLKPGQIVLLENIRFYSGEQKGDKNFAKKLSGLADIYVNDAFGNIHRPDASMLAITHYLPSYAGFLLQEEIKNLSAILASRQGLVVILGGAKISSKINLLKKFNKIADHLLIGGAMANTFLKSQKYEVGKSVLDKDYILVAKKLVSKKMLLPLDLVVASSLTANISQNVPVDKVPKNAYILDLGPETIKYYLQYLKKAKLIVWNGPLGYFENKLFVKGSKDLLTAILKTKAKTIIGGGETVELLKKLRLEKKVTFVSTGGGAMLEFLEGQKLPALERLKIK